MDTVNITGLNKAALLAEFYNNAKPFGMGILHFDPKPMTVEEAQQAIDNQGYYFDYFKGRCIKTDFEGDELRTWGYNRDYGEGAAERCVDAVRNR